LRCRSRGGTRRSQTVAAGNQTSYLYGILGYLQRIVEAGFVKCVMFGSDQMNWPAAIERAIQAIETAPFLSREQKRDILFHNAARFLRLSQEQIAAMHGGTGK
jgi:predicted TIM-barrel fold metal-dependent hydrolase